MLDVEIRAVRSLQTLFVGFILIFFCKNNKKHVVLQRMKNWKSKTEKWKGIVKDGSSGVTKPQLYRENGNFFILFE